MMVERADFDTLVDRAVAQGDRSLLRPVIEKELLHYDILFALAEAGLLGTVTFRGGTALRLCFGAPRLSEDLDFAGGRDFTTASFEALASCVERHVADRYGLAVRVKVPESTLGTRSNPADPDGTVNVLRWLAVIDTAPARPDLPRQRVRIEVANVPAHTRTPMFLQANHDFLPDGYTDTLIPVESAAEIMADKIVAAVASMERPRYRDLWDLPWLLRRGVVIDAELVGAKLRDYGLEAWSERAARFVDALPGLVHGADFERQMRRFLPDDVRARTFGREGFLEATERELVALFIKAASAVR